MKLLHVIPSVGPLRGGPSFVIRAMTEGLVKQGCEVDVITTDDNAAERLKVPLGRPVEENGVTYRYFPRQLRFYTVSWPLSQWLGKNIANYDVVHTHALFSFAIASAAWWARRRGVPYVVRPLGTLNRWGIENRRPWLKQASLRLIDRRILSGAAAVHYTSEEEREEAALVASNLRPVVIPNPVDFPFQRNQIPTGLLQAQYPMTAGKRIILFLSRLHAKKGLDLLLASFAKVRTQVPNTVLVLGGNGDAEFVEQLHRQARELGIEQDIVWAGFLKGDAKQSVMAGADLYVLPSYSENFGVAVVEALAAGLPVIVSDCVGIHREITEGEAGLVVPCREEALTGAILRLLNDAELRVSLARNGQSLAESFSPEKVAGKLVDLYGHITASVTPKKAQIQSWAV